MTNRATIHVGDALAVLRTMPSESVHCCVTDPPYGDTALAWDTRVAASWGDEVRRILKPSGSLWVFGSLRFLFELHPSMVGWRYVQDVVWEKHNGTNALNDRFRRVHEHVLQYVPAHAAWKDVYKAPRYTMDAKAKQVRRKQRPPHWGNIGAGSYTSIDGGPRLQRSVLRIRSEHGRALHPTQKPVELLEHLVLYSCPDDGLVLDPFSGSGSTGVAALQHGRRFVGIELNPSYAEMAQRRLDAVQTRIPGVA